MTAMNTSTLNHAIYAMLTLPHNAVIADLGCRDAGFLRGFTEHFPHRIKKAVGVDCTDRAFGNVPYTLPISLQVMDCNKTLNFPDNTFDFVFSKDMFECLPNKELLVNEIHRILKPNGTVICVNCDWDSIVYNGQNKDLISKAVHAYAVTQQPWMNDSDSWIGRRMYGIFHRSGLFSDTVSVHCVTETEYAPGQFGFDFAQHIGWLAESQVGVLTETEYKAFLAELERAHRCGEYLFAKPYYIYRGIKA